MIHILLVVDHDVDHDDVINIKNDIIHFKLLLTCKFRFMVNNSMVPTIVCGNSYLYHEGNKTVVLLPVCGSKKSFGSRGFLAGRDCQFLQTRLRKEA